MKNEVEKLENCAIRVKTDRETLEIRIPGRLTRGFWAFMGLALFFVFAGWLIYRFTDDFYFLVAALCMCVWFFFWTRPRRETITFDRNEIRTSGRLRPLTPYRMPTADIGGFIIKPTGLFDWKKTPMLNPIATHRHVFEQLPTFDQDCFPPGRRLFLFATTEPIPSDEEPRDFNEPLFQEQSKDLPLAVQARPEELPWLRTILTDHLEKLSSLRGD